VLARGHHLLADDLLDLVLLALEHAVLHGGGIGAVEAHLPAQGRDLAHHLRDLHPPAVEAHLVGEAVVPVAGVDVRVGIGEEEEGGPEAVALLKAEPFHEVAVPLPPGDLGQKAHQGTRRGEEGMAASPFPEKATGQAPGQLVALAETGHVVDIMGQAEFEGGGLSGRAVRRDEVVDPAGRFSGERPSRGEGLEDVVQEACLQVKLGLARGSAQESQGVGPLRRPLFSSRLDGHCRLVRWSW